jgi:hypothetical protein
MAKSKEMKGETCESKGCCCKVFAWLVPLVMIILLWVSAATWSKILITILAVFAALVHFCPCKKK